MKTIEAIVSFSGGQDSTVVAAWAKREFLNKVVLVTLNFEGRKYTEIKQAKIVAEKLNMEHHILRIPDVLAFMKEIGNPNSKDQFSSLIPLRNAMFLTYLASTAYKVNAKKIILGSVSEDIGTYPDTTIQFRKQLQKAFNTGTSWRFNPIEILAPFEKWPKYKLWKLSEELDILDLVIEHTHSCYNEDRNTKQLWGYGCNQCSSCKLRADSYFKYLQLKKKGK